MQLYPRCTKGSFTESEREHEFHTDITEFLLISINMLSEGKNCRKSSCSLSYHVNSLNEKEVKKHIHTCTFN